MTLDSGIAELGLILGTTEYKVTISSITCWSGMRCFAYTVQGLGVPSPYITFGADI